MKIIIALLIFSLIIIFHEWGHFFLARRGGIRVNEFSLGMGPAILRKKIGETVYSLKLLPFGGSCMMEGEDGAYSEEEPEEGGEERKSLPRELPADSFGAKSVWTRISVVAAGPIFNFILAFLLSLFIIGTVGYDEPVIYQVTEGFPAQAAGMEAGDKILKLNDTRIRIYREVSDYVRMHQKETVTVLYQRDGREYTVTLEPKEAENGMYYLGFTGSGVRVRGGVLRTIGYSIYEVKYCIKATLDSLGMLFAGKLSANEVSGPVGIINVIGDTYQASRSGGVFQVVLNMTYIALLLSATLGVMNLLPIPALDGGRLVFLFLEAIRGKAIDPEKEGMVHFAGFVVLMVLMVLILFNDVRNIF